MNLTLLWNNAMPATVDIPREQSAAMSTSSSAANDLAWQRAMEQAQQAGMADWFKPLAGSEANAVHGADRKTDSGAAAEAHVKAGPAATVGATAASGPAMRPAVATPAPVSEPLAQGEATEIFAGRERAADGKTAGNRGGNQGSNNEVTASPLQERVASMLPAAGAYDGAVLTGMRAGDFLSLARTETSGTLCHRESQMQSIIDDAAARLDGASSSASGSASGSAAESEAVRLYAEWRAGGVHVWIGADQRQLKAVEILPQQLRQWLSGQGEQLAGLVVNGRSVLRIDPGGSQE